MTEKSQSQKPLSLYSELDTFVLRQNKSCGVPSYYVFTGFCCNNIRKHQLTKGSTMSSKPHLPYHLFVPCWQVESRIIWVWFQPLIMIRHGQIKYQAPSLLSKVLSMQNHQYLLCSMLQLVVQTWSPCFGIQVPNMICNPTIDWSCSEGWQLEAHYGPQSWNRHSVSHQDCFTPEH